MKLKNKEVIEIYNILEQVKNINATKPMSYIYKSAKNKKALQGEIDTLKEIEPKLRRKYGAEQNKIQEKYIKRDEEGNAVLKDGVNVSPDGKVAFSDVEFENVDEMNKELTEFANGYDWKAVEEEETEYVKLLENEVEVELVTFGEADGFDGMNEAMFSRLVEIGVWEI